MNDLDVLWVTFTTIKAITGICSGEAGIKSVILINPVHPTAGLAIIMNNFHVLGVTFTTVRANTRKKWMRL